jgi:hypothetical protein
MNISLSYFLFAYLIFLAIWLVLSLTGLYHLYKFGFKIAATYISIAAYLIISILILVITYGFLNTIDWSEKITILQWLGSTSPF